MTTLTQTDLYDLVANLDEILCELRELADDSHLEALANRLEERLDILTSEPTDVRDLRYALRPFGYDCHTPMMPNQKDYGYLVTPQEYSEILPSILAIKQNAGLSLSVTMSEHEVDQNGLPYIEIVVNRA